MKRKCSPTCRNLIGKFYFALIIYSSYQNLFTINYGSTCLKILSQIRQCTAFSPALRWQSQMSLCEIRANLIYIVNTRLDQHYRLRMSQNKKIGK